MFEIDWENGRRALARWCVNAVRAGVFSASGAALGMALAPVVQALGNGDWGALAAFSSLLGANVGGNVLSQWLWRWKDAGVGEDLAARIARDVDENEELHHEAAEVLAQEEVARRVCDVFEGAERAGFIDTLRAELESRGQRFPDAIRQTADLPGAGNIIQVAVKGEARDITIYAPASSPPPATSTAPRTAYLRYIFETASRVPLGGIDPKVAAGSEERLHLGAVYTGLLTMTPAEAECDGSRWRKGSREDLLSRGDEQRRLSAVEQLDCQPRLAVLGDPGSGKSTFVKFVAMCLAGEALRESAVNLDLMTAPLPDDDGDVGKDRQPWRHGAALPVLVTLRDFAARGLPSVGDQPTAQCLWDFIVRELASHELADYAETLKHELREHGGLLLLDGLDEVPEADARREQIKLVVDDFIRAFHNCRVLLTCRTYAYQHQDWQLPGFRTATLAPFSAGQIRQFVDRWYAHTAAVTGRYRDDARGRAALLKDRIISNKHLRELAERPLLLTLMASLHAWRGGSLPEKREELYSDAVELLLERWQQGRQGVDAAGRPVIEQPCLTEFLKVGKDPIREVLNRLAYEAHQGQADAAGTADVPEGELVSALMAIKSRAAEVNPAKLVDYLSRQAGLLIPRGVRVYTFPHRTFQEYLAACHLTDEPHFAERLSAHVTTDPHRWREVALLAAAKVGRGAAGYVWNLADELCCGTLQEQDVTLGAVWGARVAGEVLVESTTRENLSERQEASLRRIRQALVRVMRADDSLPALERAGAGNSLAQLGDPRFRADACYLPDDARLGFVEIPAGEFLMGSNKKDDPDTDDDELPRHRVELPAYYIGKYPVTVAQFRAFVEANPGFEIEDPDCLKGSANHPVVCVTWHEALAYCAWLTEMLRSRQAQYGALFPAFAGREWTVTLPSEAEWEKAARGTEARRYPWGPDWDANRANCSETGIDGTSAVGCFPGGASPYEVEDMSGNVLEWTRSKYVDYPYKVDKRESSKGDEARVLRGGSWRFDIPWVFRAAIRIWFAPRGRVGDVGFRCVVRSPGP